MIRTCFFILLTWGSTGAQVFAQDILIAGVNPAERPANAPVITEVSQVPQRHTDALAGVTEPYPESLQFLDDQGHWFTPFSHPGMVGPYDIRDWH